MNYHSLLRFFNRSVTTTVPLGTFIIVSELKSINLRYLHDKWRPYVSLYKYRKFERGGGALTLKLKFFWYIACSWCRDVSPCYHLPILHKTNKENIVWSARWHLLDGQAGKKKKYSIYVHAPYSLCRSTTCNSYKNFSALLISNITITFCLSLLSSVIIIHNCIIVCSFFSDK